MGFNVASRDEDSILDKKIDISIVPNVHYSAMDKQEDIEEEGCTKNDKSIVNKFINLVHLSAFLIEMGHSPS